MSDGDASERFYVVASPPNTPGQCAICGTGDHPKGFVVTQLDFEFYGSLYFCHDCALSLARAVGALNPETALRIQNEKLQLENQVYELKQRLAKFEKLGELVGQLGIASSSPDPISNNRPIADIPIIHDAPQEASGESTTEPDPEPEPVKSEPINTVTSSEQVVNPFVIEQRPDDVYSLGDDDAALIAGVPFYDANSRAAD